MSLSIQKLNKHFGRKYIFTDFSYEFSDRGIYLLLGNSGVGKTTLLRIIAGLDKNFGGSVLLSNASTVSVAFQEYRLFPTLTALENVMIASKDEGEDSLLAAEALLLKLGFTKDEMNLYTDELSGGMKQRVSLARAFFANSDILLLDEPTKELNRELCDVVLQMIKDAGKERLVIVVTHNYDDVKELCATEIRI